MFNNYRKFLTINVLHFTCNPVGSSALPFYSGACLLILVIFAFTMKKLISLKQFISMVVKFQAMQGTTEGSVGVVERERARERSWREGLGLFVTSQVTL